MQPGLSRAVPMAIIGFLLGALLVIIIRGLQQLDPLWAPGPGIILSAPMMAAFFVWGMGAFDPKLSAHGEAAEEAAHEALAEEAEKPRSLLIGPVWQLTALLIGLLVVLGGFAALPRGLALTQTVSDYASPTMVGFVPFDLPFGGPTIYVSQLVLFALFIIWTLISLAVAAGIIGWAIMFMSRGVTEASVIAKGGAAALPAPTQPAPSPEDARQTALSIIQVLAALVLIFIVLYVIVGLLFPQLQLPLLSLVLSTHDQVVLIAVVGSLIITRLALGRERLMLALPFLGWFIALYWVFYYVAIGLIIPKPDVPGLSIFFPNDPQSQLEILSGVNAVIFTLVILRTQLVLAVIGRVAGWLARVLRSIPRFLQ